MSVTEVFTTSVVEHRPVRVAASRPDQLVADLYRCEAACRALQEAGLVATDLARWRTGITLASSCAEICNMTAALLARADHGVQRLSRSALELCADAGRQCAAECDRQPGVAALTCAEACRQMVRSIGAVVPTCATARHERGPHWSVDPVPRATDAGG